MDIYFNTNYASGIIGNNFFHWVVMSLEWVYDGSIWNFVYIPVKFINIK